MRNPRIDNLCEILGIELHYDFTKLRIVWEGDGDKASLYGLRGSKFILLRKIDLEVLAILINLLVFRDPLRIESGISSIHEKPLLKDDELGNILSVTLDFPLDVAQISYETGPLELEFGENHSDYIRSTFKLS